MLFQGIMLDTGIAKISTTKKSQFKALQCGMSEIELNITCGNEVTICFETGMPLNLIDLIQVFIPVGITNFHIVDTSIPFFLFLKDINIPGIY